MCEAEHEHLQRLAAALPPEQHTPELRLLLGCYEDGAAAAELLRGVEERVAGGSSLREVLLAEDAELFRGLVLFLQSNAKGVVSIDTTRLLNCRRLLLQCAYVMGVLRPDGRVYVPGWATGHRTAALPACNTLAALAAGVALSMTAANKPDFHEIAAAVALVEQTLRMLWAEDTGDAARQLGASSHGLPRRTAAAATAAAAILAAPPSPSAAALAAALERHCPGVSLAQLRASALVLHISAVALWLNALEESGRPPDAACRACTHRALQHCCLLVHSGEGDEAAYCYRMAIRLTSSPSLLPPPAAVVGMMEEGLAWAKERQCWYAAVDIGGSLAAIYADRGSPHPALPRAAQLLADLRRMERRLRPWLPPVKLAQLRQPLDIVEAVLRPSGAPFRSLPDPIPLRTCSGCGRQALYLRLCSGCRAASYCSRECQRRDWREGGHKQRCTALAAQRQRRQEGGAALGLSGGEHREGDSGGSQRAAQRAEVRSTPCSGSGS